MKRMVRWSGLTASLAAMGLMGSVATAATPTSISGMTAAVSGSQVQVSGSVAFGGQDPVMVAEDPAGDNLGGAETGALGLDIQKLYISQPVASTNNLLFTMQLGGLTGGGIPEAFQYNWDIAVDGGADAGGANWSIKSMRSGQGTQAGNQGPWAALTRCVPDPSSPTGGYTCSTVTPLLAVTYDQTAGQIQITVPLSRISAKAGSTISAWARNGQPVWIRTSAAGATTGFVTVDDTSHDDFMVPKKTVDLGIARAGDPIDFKTPATVPTASTSFSGSVAKPVTVGAHDVAARACFGDNCSVASLSLTL